MSIDVTVETLIARPVDEVAAFVLESANEPQWIKGIQESVPLDAGAIAAGSKVRRVATFMGRRMEYTPEVQVFVPNERLVMRTDRPFPMTIEYIFTGWMGGTRFSQRLVGGPTGLAALFSPLIRIMVRRNVRSDMERLRTMLERRGGGRPDADNTVSGV